MHSKETPNRILLIILLSSPKLFQSQTSILEFKILGTMHFGNNNINNKSLYNELEKAKPEIILIEDWKAYKKVRGLRTAKFLRIWKPTVEQMTIQKYKSKHKDVEIIPIDSIFDHNNYAKNINIKENEIEILIKNTSLSKEEKVLLNKLREKEKIFENEMTNASILELNKKEFVDLFTEFYFERKKFQKDILQKYYSNTALTNWFIQNEIFHNEREKIMSDKINKVICENRNKRIILLVGLVHKNPLQNNTTRSGCR
jgi:hypothetical protein